MFDAPVEVPPAGEYVADGAARQAAWALSGLDSPPVWDSMNRGITHRVDPVAVPEIRERYQQVRSQVYAV
jgi:xylulokinase